MRSSSTSTALQEVLAILELVETILLHLPIAHIIKAQIVCSNFHRIITKSLTLQQKLFLKPILLEIATSSQPNPLLAHKNASRFIDLRKGMDHTSLEKYTWPDNRELVRQLDWNEWAKHHHRYTVNDASWRKMLVVNPPIKLLKFSIGEWSWEAYNKRGVTMGQLENAYTNCCDIFRIDEDGVGMIDPIRIRGI
ncbi:hypothetical protein BJ878DRAFT_426815 [Calycina marina]|uniref:F-box domain-containing protein n=1 Tax=Calycina marina TaxID=1763456 RepID=A0A9P7YY79_9HELO|nr:hypothetical protein BJ878DRAFT_426815 [Calycina marina]